MVNNTNLCSNRASEIKVSKELLKTLTRYLNNHVVLMDDINAQAGAKQCKEEYVLRNFSQEISNPHGEGMVFLLKYNLMLLNSFYKKHQNNKRISLDGSTKNETDYITTNYPKTSTDTSVLIKFSFNTILSIKNSNIRIKPLK